MMEEGVYDERVGDPKYEADDEREAERDRQDRYAWLVELERALQVRR